MVRGQTQKFRVLENDREPKGSGGSSAKALGNVAVAAARSGGAVAVAASIGPTGTAAATAYRRDPASDPAARPAIEPAGFAANAPSPLAGEVSAKRTEGVAPTDKARKPPKPA
jgi:hypothetical protein